MRALGKTTVATSLALIGFAANSILCRMALGSRAIDAWTFTLVRLASGAIVLGLLAFAASARKGTSDVERAPTRSRGSWLSSLALFVYAAAFSLAYLHVSAGVGALVLFASVQATMFGWSLREGSRPRASEWAGLGIALTGLALLARPGAGETDPRALASMILAGIAWGTYSLRGRTSVSPLATTAANFARSVPMALVGWLAFRATANSTPRGLTLAIASGALASGLGYSLWYLALPSLSATRAAVIQLCVPVIAAATGIALLGEHLTTRLFIAGVLILGGVGVAVSARSKSRAARRRPDDVVQESQS